MQPGTRLEHYEIVDKIGEGGMGAVYRAEDTRLRRPVAIKVLPPEVSSDTERLARLQREAQLLASLSHPNVATVHGFGEAQVDEDGVRRHVAFLVMELVEGESLYDRVAAGPIPWREATQIAAGIAAGLEAAHERGIVHRDLKPANVHLTSEGGVKVLDFGLAKAFDADGTSGSLELSASPTVAAATRTGIILGTAAYMSPEQARGKAVDKRADIWALGCVLFEMLAGRKAFEGETVSDVLAAILKEQPDLEALPPLPARLRGLLERLLQKDPKARMRDVGDVRLELQAALSERARAATPGTAGLSWKVAAPAAAVLLLAGVVAGWLLRPAPPAPPEARVMLAPDSIAGGTDALAVSPDGTLVAESVPSQGIRMRRLDDAGWRQMPDTEGAWALAFDAASGRLYFERQREVLSLGIDGSTPLVEATFEAGTQIYAVFRGIAGDIQASTWKDGDTRIVRIPPGGGAEELWRGNAGGGSRLIVTTELAPGRWIAWAGTPGGSAGLAVVGAGIETPQVILDGYRHPLHMGDGEVLTVDDRGRLAAARFEPGSGAVVAQPVVRVEGLALLGSSPAYDVAADGMLAYVAGDVSEAGETLTWLDRNGGQMVATARKGTHDTDSRLAPDGLSLALEVAGDENAPISVWIHDLERDVRAALTPGIRATFPVWSPDSRHVIALLADGIEPQGIYVVPVDRSEPPRLLLARPEEEFVLPMDWSPDGASLLYVQSDTQVRSRAASNDIWRLPLAGGDPEPFLATGASEIDARYSPDGRWVSYASDQSGQYEIYLRPAAGGGEIRVSADGGLDAEWNPSGGELFFLRGRDLYSVEVRNDAARPVGAERKILTLPANARGRFLLPGADGQRFVISAFGDEAQQANTVLAILNWRRDAGR